MASVLLREAVRYTPSAQVPAWRQLRAVLLHKVMEPVADADVRTSSCERI